MVPEEAIVPQGGRQVLFLLGREGEGEQARAVARRAEVTLGLRRAGMVEVLSGVQAGDSVIVAGQQRLQRDGMPVRVIDMCRPPGGPGGGGAGPAQAAPRQQG